MTLSARILIALVAGAVAGAVAQVAGAGVIRDAILWLEPLGTIFIRLVGMVVVPLVIASLFVGIASLGDVRRLGGIGGRTLLWFGASTLCAAGIGVAVALATGVGRGGDVETLNPAFTRTELVGEAQGGATHVDAPSN